MGSMDMEVLQFIDQLGWEVGWIQCLSFALGLSGHLSEQCIYRNSISGWGWCILREQPSVRQYVCNVANIVAVIQWATRVHSLCWKARIWSPSIQHMKQW